MSRRDRTRRGWLALCVACTAACAARHTTADRLAPRFAEPAARQARQAAPDLMAEAERALGRARSAAQPALREQAAAVAERLLDAALAETRRSAAERACQRLETRWATAVEERARLEREARIRERERARLQAGERAGLEARRGFEPDPGVAPPAPREQAALFESRARLVLASALALGFDALRGAAVVAQLEHGKLVSQHALDDAERALGEARQARGAIVPEEVSALREMASERGLAQAVTPDGFAMLLRHGFDAKSTALNARGTRQLAALAALARAHPFGAIRVEVWPCTPLPSAAPGCADARARRVSEALARTLGRGRLEVGSPASQPADDAAQAQVVFTAYALPPAATACRDEPDALRRCRAP